MKKFCFDLDGTIFKGESLPHIAKANGLWEEYLRVATCSEKDDYVNVSVTGHQKGNEISTCEETDNNREETDNGNNENNADKSNKDIQDIRWQNAENDKRLARYKKNLLKRIAVLEKVPVKIAVEAINRFEVNEKIVEFIKKHKDQCAVITSNLDCWVGSFLDTLGCEYHTSKALVKDGYITAMENILDKRSVVNQYKTEEYVVVYVGDGLNDIDAMEAADVSIAFLASDNSWKRLGEICDYCCYDQETLVELLENIIKER